MYQLLTDWNKNKIFWQSKGDTWEVIVSKIFSYEMLMCIIKINKVNIKFIFTRHKLFGPFNARFFFL